MDGKGLKERRQKLGLTRRQLALLLGVTESSVYNWETGKASIKPERKAALEIIEAKFNERKNTACLKTV